MAGSKPDWNAGLVPPSPSCAQGCRRAVEVDLPQHSCRTGDCFYSKAAREGPSAINIDNPYLTKEYLDTLEDKHPMRNYAETYLLGEWKTTPIKPCPFCGNRDLRTEGMGASHNVYCNQCEADGPVGRTEDQAVELWNTRSQSGSVPQSGA